MRIFVLTGVYWPDTASVAQHLADLCETLVSEGHEVTVLSSRYAYEDPSIAYPLSETHSGVQIQRIRSTRFDKHRIVNRVLNFMSFNLLTFWRLLFLKANRYDLMLGLTVPPLVSFFGVLCAKFKKIPFVYWAMDMQPELAIASGLMREGSLTARLMTRMGNYIMRSSSGIIALDRFMAAYISQRAHPTAGVKNIAVWPVMSQIYEGSHADNPFRQAHNFGDKIVIMYSGNHSFVHPLDTWLAAALALKNHPEFLFVSVGAGVRIKDVAQFKTLHALENIILLPFQPREMIHYSLGSSDIQVVILGEGQVAFTHPNKVYGAMFIGKPILYIGPSPSHVSDIAQYCAGNLSVQHGETDALVAQLLAFAALSPEDRAAIGARNRAFANQNFSPEVLRKNMSEAVLSFRK